MPSGWDLSEADFKVIPGETWHLLQGHLDLGGQTQADPAQQILSHLPTQAWQIYSWTGQEPRTATLSVGTRNSWETVSVCYPQNIPRSSQELELSRLLQVRHGLRTKNKFRSANSFLVLSDQEHVA